MDDSDLLTLCVFKEAAGEPQDGKAAVARVVLNRTNRKPPYASDGTIRGTILHHSQFSWVNWDFVNGQYQEVAFSPDVVEARVERLFKESQIYRTTWAACDDIAKDVLAGTYSGGPEYEKLGDDAVLYLNPKIVAKLPAWADPAKLLAVIGAHHFFSA